MKVRVRVKVRVGGARVRVRLESGLGLGECAQHNQTTEVLFFLWIILVRVLPCFV